MAKKRKPRTPPSNFGRPPDPDADWNKDEISVDEALEQAKQIVEKIDGAPNDVQRRAVNFLEDVRDRVTSMTETMTNSRRCSERQKSALDNWEGAIDKMIFESKDPTDNYSDDD